jgi:predicted ATPase
VLQGALPDMAIPATLQDSLLSRFDRLEDTKEIAQFGAAIGREFSHRLLAAVVSMNDEAIDHALERLIGTELVYRRGTPPDATYVFKHALVQEAAYETLLRSRRQEIHAQIARVLESEFPDRVANEPEVVAH